MIAEFLNHFSSSRKFLIQMLTVTKGDKTPTTDWFARLDSTRGFEIPEKHNDSNLFQLFGVLHWKKFKFSLW